MNRTTKKSSPKGHWWRRAATGARAALERIAVRSGEETGVPRPRMLDSMELEDRVLFSAAPLAMAVAPQGPAAAPKHFHRLDHQAADAADPSGNVAGSAVHALAGASHAARIAHRGAGARTDNAGLVNNGVAAHGVNVVLIDSQLADVGQLEAAVAPGSKIFVYDSQHDTAADVLHHVVAWADATGSRIDDLAILSHGVGGAFELGNQWITATSLASTAPAWQELGGVLATGANIELFGCDVAAPGSAGQELLDGLASITHAAVFASSDVTGAGGNWTLEAASTGASATTLSTSSVPLNVGLLANYSGVLATIAIDTTSSANSAIGNSLTFSHTVNSGSNRILIVEVGIRQGGANETVASITYGGQALTLAGTAELNTQADAEIWYLLAPAVGTANVVVTLNGGHPFVAGATDYFGVDQSTPLGTLAAATGSNSTPSVNVSSAPGQLVVDMVVAQGDSNSIAVSGSGQVQLWNQNTGSSGGDARGGDSYQNGASSVTMSWSEGNTQSWAIAAVPLQQSPNSAPVLAGANNFTTITEDQTSNSGDLVSTLIAGQVTDADTGALQGIAVAGLVNSTGAWQYSIDGGSSWTAFGTPSATTARLLASDGSTFVRFVPNANWNGTVNNGITFEAWDQSTGVAGGTADASVNGGTTAFSSATASASITVTPVNDAPTLGNGVLTAVNEDTFNPSGQTVSTIFAGQFADVDTGSSFGGIAVVGNTADPGTQGIWQYSGNGGANWFAIGTVADGATALAISSSTLIRFAPVANYNGAPPALVVRGLDNTYAGGFSTTSSGETGVNVDTTSNGGATAIAAVAANLSTTITALPNQIVVNTTSDIADGDTSSIAALKANPGADGLVSLREAITATNNTANGGTPNEIVFAIPTSDAGYNNTTGVFTIAPGSILPSITNALIIDGATQATNIGNTNPGQMGAGGTVGVDGLTLSQVDSMIPKCRSINLRRVTAF